MNDFIEIAYEKADNGDIPILLVTRKTIRPKPGMEIVKVFTEDEAEKLYSILTD